MVDTLASIRHVSAAEIEDTHTYDQLQLRYFFYVRERNRDAKRIAFEVCKMAGLIEVA